MAITQAFCNSFKRELFLGIHNCANGGDVFKVALYTSAATLNKSTTAYTATNEVTGTGYTAGGKTLDNVDPALSNDAAVLDFADVTWPGSTITARGCLIYNSSKANRAASVHDFGADRSTFNGVFELSFPTADDVNAIIKIT